jgi:hypothetical protein
MSNGLAHRVGTRDIGWQLATLSVPLYFPCTPSSLGVGVSTAATNPLGLSLSPFPLFLPQVLFGLFPKSGLPWKPAAGLDAGSRLRLTVESVLEETHAQGCVFEFDSTPNLPQAGIGKPQPATQRKKKSKREVRQVDILDVLVDGGGEGGRGNEGAVNTVFSILFPRLCGRERIFSNTLS